ncbi:MAG TPA: DUF1080 domain-containing protein [Tepidisphaeraceae bacterium]|jgi:hypothetical protein|nr:DUF1080 domain-containing protein [Tepidisphaeraceae bacterium]
MSEPHVSLRQRWFFVLLAMPLTAAAATGPEVLSPIPTTAPAATQPAADIVGDRVTFLVTRLAGVEASLKAVETELKTAGYQAGVSADRAKRYQQGNELMDRKGGGPMAWDQFYGKTASAFYYHPTDANTRYRFDNDNPHGLAPVPTAQRPPQLDYFYRANDQRALQAREDAAALTGRVDALLQRHRQLESQQAILWTRVAAAMIAQRQMADQPLYTHALRAEPASHALATAAAGRFLLYTDLAAEELADLPSSQDPPVLFTWLRDLLTQARHELQDQIAPLGSADPEAAAAVRPLLASIRRLSVIADNIADAGQTAVDADAAGDEAQKRSARALVQTGLLEFAEAVTALDEDLLNLSGRWKVEPLANLRSDFPKLPPLPKPAEHHASVPPATVSAVAQAPSHADPLPIPTPALNPGIAPVDPATEGFTSLFDGSTFHGWCGADHDGVPAGWEIIENCLVRTGHDGGKHENIRTSSEFTDFELDLEFRVEPGKTNSGIFYRGGPEYQIIDNQGHPNGRQALTACGSDYSLHAVTRPDAARPAGQWNTVRLVVQGTHVEHWLNGVCVVTYELETPEWRQLIAQHPHLTQQPGFGLQRPAPIVLQSNSGRTWFRAIRIRPL